LLNSKSGHCEYFASGMVVMLRSIGIPARMANGFHGGVWNEFGRYYAIRQADAHAWVEVYFPGYGWLTFEPTPASGALAPNQQDWATRIQSWMDSMKLQWFKWVIEYDLEKQVDVFRQIGRSLSGLGGAGGEGDLERETEQVREVVGNLFSKRNFLVFMLIAGFMVVLLLLWRSGLWGVRGGLERDQLRARRAWQEWLRILRQAGEFQPIHRNPEEIVRYMETAGWRCWQEARTLSVCIQEVRFGKRAWTEHTQNSAKQALEAIRQESRERKRRARRAA